MKKNSSEPLVTVLCIAFNQSKYIAQALDSLLAQVTNFQYEIVVHDDASTDGTCDIIREYEKANPGILSVNYESQNQFSKNGVQFLKDMYINAKGKYIAICEGDDYWTDVYKLQKQVDFLEKHYQYSIVFHRVNVFTEGSTKGQFLFPDPKENSKFTVNNLLRRNFIQTNSVMYRRQEYFELPTRITPFDWYMHLYHAQYGEIGFIDEVMSSYRRHPGGLWWEATVNIDEVWKKHGLAHLALYAELIKLYGGDRKAKEILDNSVINMFHNLRNVDKKYRTNLTEEAFATFPRLAVNYTLNLYKQIDSLRRHSDEQAKIIQHQINLTEELRSVSQKENQALAQELTKLKSRPLNRLESAARSALKRNGAN